MDVVVKVIIDEKEYDRLLDIEQKYKDITQHNTLSLSQRGAGIAQNSASHEMQQNVPLDEIVSQNAEANAVETPIPGLLPSITTPADETSTSNIKEKDTKKYKKKHTKRGNGKTPKLGDGAGTSKLGDSAEKAVNAENLGIVEFVYPWYYIGAPHS